jgi:hypothetical protein
MESVVSVQRSAVSALPRGQPLTADTPWISLFRHGLGLSVAARLQLSSRRNRRICGEFTSPLPEMADNLWASTDLSFIIYIYHLASDPAAGRLAMRSENEP